MKYKIGQVVDFDWDNYDYYYNTDLVYEGTERLTGKIASYDEVSCHYSIDVNGVLYLVKEDSIVDKSAEFKHNLIDMKIKIADAVLKRWDELKFCEGLKGELNEIVSKLYEHQ